MIRKSAQFEQSVQLRRRGFTYAEIAKIVGVSKGTISNWLKNEAWSESIRERNEGRRAKENAKRISLLNTARGNQHKKLYVEAERSAATEFKHYKHSPLFIAGVTLYMAQGDLLSPNTLRMSSTRKDVHKLFIAFVQEFLGVPRENIRFWLLLYPATKPLATSRAWSKHLKLPLSQFGKYQVSTVSSKKGTLHEGVGNTIIGGTVLKKKLSKWLELASKEFYR